MCGHVCVCECIFLFADMCVCEKVCYVHLQTCMHCEMRTHVRRGSEVLTSIAEPAGCNSIHLHLRSHLGSPVLGPLPENFSLVEWVQQAS